MSRIASKSGTLVFAFIIAFLVSATAWPTSTCSAQETTDPFAVPTKRGADIAPTTGTPSSGFTNPILAAASKSKCPMLSQKFCKRASNTMLAMAGGYVLVCLVLGILFNLLWSRRGTSGAWVRFLVPLTILGAAAGLLVGFDPLKSPGVICCLASGTFRAVLLLGDSAPARGVLLGAIPLAVLYIIIVITIHAIQRRHAG